MVLVETAGSNGGVETRAVDAASVALPVELRPRMAGVVQRPGTEPAQPVATVVQTAPHVDGVSLHGRA